MKFSIIFATSLIFATGALAMQSPESADRDRCFHQYKENPAGIHKDTICLRLADKYPATFRDLHYLIGFSYQLDGQPQKAEEYFRRIEKVDREYRRETAERLYDPVAASQAQ